jgi:hypothetical protein
VENARDSIIKISPSTPLPYFMVFAAWKNKILTNQKLEDKWLVKVPLPIKGTQNS